MFDGIKMQKYQMNISLTNRNAMQKYQYNFGSNCKNIEIDMRESQFMEQQNGEYKSEFCLDGTLWTVAHPPLSETAKINLFYMASFALWQSGSQYFTMRENVAYYLLMVTYDGEGILEYDGCQFTLTKGSVFLIDCRLPHFYKTVGPKWEHAEILFGGAYSQQYFDVIRKSKSYVFYQSESGRLQRTLESLVQLYGDVVPNRELLISAKLNELLDEVLRTSIPHQKALNLMPENLKQTVLYITEHYMDHLKIDDLAAHCKLSNSYFLRIFRQYMNCTPKSYILTLQIENAKQLLEMSTKSVSEIAEAVGVYEVRYFCYLFRQHVGVTPREYRQRAHGL